jgi:hypothetical protein
LIVITGLGRSGTSLLAAIYRELGFDPGGTWFPEINAGLEADPVVEANELIAQDLGISFLGPGDRSPGRFRMRLESSRSSALRRLLPRPYDPVDRDDALAVAEARRDQLCAIAASLDVVKDPRFCWTLGVWGAAGAPIDHVVMTMRNLDAVVRSRRRAGHANFPSDAAARDAFTYALGLCVSALHDHRIPHAAVRYPDLLDDFDSVYTALVFPRPVDRDDFVAAAKAVARRDLVHDWR